MHLKSPQMSSNEPNRLAWEEYTLELEGGFPMPFWRVSINGVARWPEARPFCASDGHIKLGECTICGNCGLLNTIVRRAGKSIVWLGDAAIELSCREFAPGEALCFDVSEYLKVIGHGSTFLPVLNSREIRAELQLQSIPDPRDGLYRDPDSTFDDMGRKMLALSRDIIEGGAEWTCCEPPAVYNEIRVGLELPDVPEVIWRVGAQGDQICLQFVALPRLPAWVTADWSTDIRERLREVCF